MKFVSKHTTIIHVHQFFHEKISVFYAIYLEANVMN